MKPENRFRSRINTKLPKTLHHQHFVAARGGLNGTPDEYYDGIISDLWVEYKFNPSMPRNGIVVGDYSDLQLQWMTRRFNNGGFFDPQRGGMVHNVVGIVGLPKYMACIQFTPEEWHNGTRIETAIPEAEVVAWIRDFCGV